MNVIKQDQVIIIAQTMSTWTKQSDISQKTRKLGIFHNKSAVHYPEHDIHDQITNQITQYMNINTVSLFLEL